MNNIILKKNDLKNIHKFNENTFIFENDNVKELYYKYKNKTILEVRIDICINEDYFYLDLSEMDLTNDDLLLIFENKEIKSLLYKIEMLDLTYNKLTKNINLNEYRNIKYLNIAFNDICHIVECKHIIELNCEHNKITKIISDSIIKLTAHDNLIQDVELEDINYLIIYNNKLTKINNYKNIETLDCINNNILNIDYIKSLKSLYCSTNRISKDYNILNIEKINNNYYVDFI
jgi:hypothetical protein